VSYAIYVLGGVAIGFAVAAVIMLGLNRVVVMEPAVSLLVGLSIGFVCGCAGAFAGIALYDRRHPLL
jgi:hypothetical protein